MADTLKRLEYFACLAGIEHYGKAAEKLGIAQSALSQQIKSLEQEVGVRLFDPAGRGIRLSLAGKNYYDSVRDLLDRHVSAISKARKTASGESGHVTISHVGTTLYDVKFLSILRLFRELYPSVGISLVELEMNEQLILLAQRKIDLAFIRGPQPVLPDGTFSKVFSRHRLFVAMSPSHPLSGLNRLSLSQLKDDAFVGYQDRNNYGITSLLIRLAQAAGFNPRIEWRVSAVSNALGMVNAWNAVSLVPDCIVSFNIGNIVYIPLEDENAWSDLLLIGIDEQRTPLQTTLLEHFSQCDTPAETTRDSV